MLKYSRAQPLFRPFVGLPQRVEMGEANVRAASAPLAFRSTESVRRSSLVLDQAPLGQLLLGPVQVDVGPREVHEEGVGGADARHQRQARRPRRGRLHLVVRHCLQAFL